MMSALITAPNDEVNQPRFYCSTGNCTWAPIATLGFCSKCTDLTPQINLNCTTYSTGNNQICTATLSEETAGLYFIGTQASFESLMNITQVGGMEGLRYHSIRMLPPYAMSGATRQPVTLSNFSATECSLSLCVRSLQPSVTSGIYSETPLDTFTETPPSNIPWTNQRLQPPWGPERGIDPAANLSFGLNYFLYDDWSDSKFLLNSYTIPGWATTRDGHTGIDLCVADGADCTRNSIPGYIFNANYTPSACGSPNADTFACSMDGIAAALTKTVRNAGVIANGTDVGDEFLVRGSAEIAATFIRVDWVWIALPCAVWLLGLVAWAVVALQTRHMRLPTWRDDPLPLVFLYRDGDERRGSTGSRDGLLADDDCSSWAYEKVAEDVKVQLREVSSQPGGGGRMMRLVRAEKG